MLDVYNVLAKSFRRVRDALREPTNHSLRLRIAGTRVDNDRRYELPTGTELAGLCRITSLNPLFDSLHFPLLFPYGNDGYHNRIRYNPAYRDPTKKRKYVTQREYYCFRLQYRQNEGKTLIRSGKALQHFCIDAFTTIEQNRLTYLRLNQKKLRSDLYKGLYVSPILVSNNCTGGVRYMQQLYQDAMALCRHYKNPDLFITFTCNKRGLPHVHIILWLADDCKPKTAALVDKIISAELPDPLIDPVGYDAVTKFMVHGPCGDSRPSSPCMKHGRCSKFFPKQFATETTFDSTGCVTYRRRETTVTAEKSNTILDNRHVVPYNRDLLVKYQAHINVEVCHKGQLIKYLFKYITKGPDRNQSVQAVVNRPDVEKTMLTEWFTLNRTYPSARKLTYAEIPQNFIWDKQCSQWVPRKQGFVIGRIASVPPQANDVFYLRLLLTKIPGALTFEDLRTVNGIRYNDYRQACQALGLLATDDEWNEVMAEVSRWGMPPLIRTTISRVRSLGQIAIVVASSGIAATLLPGGITAHSQFKIPIEVDHASTCAIKKGTTLARLLELATLIVWDEAPMVHKHSFEAVDRTLCDIMNKPTYLSSDTLTSPGTDQTALEIEYPTEFLNGLSYNGMPEHQLRFKQYSIVMLLRNLNPAAGLCNGTRILITHLGTNVIRGLIVGGTFEGTIAIIPRIVLDKTDPKWPFTLKRRQYPLRLCYGMTINKSQGQTLDQIGIFLPTPVFSHGQLYVALSRVRSAAGIHIVLQDTSKADYNCTRNIVYTEIFQDLQIQETSSVPRSM
ncbi:ATP-dependent DNA helicase PIF1 [Linum grandiflorum]